MTRLEDIPSWRLRQMLGRYDDHRRALAAELVDDFFEELDVFEFAEDVIRGELERRMKTK